MNLFRRFRLFVAVLPVVLAVVVLKVAVRGFGLEFLALNGLIPSIVAAAIFLIGFLLSHVLSDYKEAERTLSDMRVALEAMHADIAAFAGKQASVDMGAVRCALADVVVRFETSLGRGEAQLEPALATIERLTDL